MSDDKRLSRHPALYGRDGIKDEQLRYMMRLATASDWDIEYDHVHEDIMKAAKEIADHGFNDGHIEIPFQIRDIKADWNGLRERTITRAYDEAKWWQLRLRWHRWKYNRKLKKFAKRMDREMHYGTTTDDEGEGLL